MHPTIKIKIKIMGDYMEQLAPYVELDKDALLRNPEKRLVMERLFLLMVDEAFDINAALAYQLGGKIADEYKSTFLELVPLKIVDHEFAVRISESARIRNQLTHSYEKLTHAETIEEIKKFYVMYKEYGKILVEKFIKTEKAPI